jgi:ABC-type Fe3+/spermidine/putrescine transport system ATPase subunit
MTGEVVVPFHQTQVEQTQGWQTQVWQPRDETESDLGRSAALTVRGLNKVYGSETVLDDMSFTIAEGESLVLLGHSGSGKTTTLRLIAGLEIPDGGEISLHGRQIGRLQARERNVGVIFQNYALFPRMTVAENIGFGLKIRGVKKKKREEVIEKLLAMIGLQDQREKFPSQISGGQQQRVAIARALAYEPEILLFDESFSALDPQTRVALRREIRALLRKLRIPAMFITHDQEEAMELGDQIAILNRGRIEQIGTPDEVYNEPQNEFVATFLGAANVVEGTWGEGVITLDCGRQLPAPHPIPSMMMQRAKIMFRPEDITLSRYAGYGESPYSLGRGEVLDSSFAGATETLTVRIYPQGYEERRADSIGDAHPSCNFIVKVIRTKWDARRFRLGPGDQAIVGLKSYKILQGE